MIPRSVKYRVPHLKLHCLPYTPNPSPTLSERFAVMVCKTSKIKLFQRFYGNQPSLNVLCEMKDCKLQNKQQRPDLGRNERFLHNVRSKNNDNSEEHLSNFKCKYKHKVLGKLADEFVTKFLIFFITEINNLFNGFRDN